MCVFCIPLLSILTGPVKSLLAATQCCSQWRFLLLCKTLHKVTIYFVVTFFVFCVQVFVKALFDYDPMEDKAIPCKEAGLPFKKGCILQIMSEDDATWWQAKVDGVANPRAGLIPSKQFQERYIYSRWSIVLPTRTICCHWTKPINLSLLH